MTDHRIHVPAREGRAVRVEAGRSFRVVDLDGGQVGDLFAAHFPSGSRIDEKTTIGMACHRQSAIAIGSERVSMSTRHRDAAFAVERQLRSSLKHSVPRRQPVHEANTD